MDDEEISGVDILKENDTHDLKLYELPLEAGKSYLVRVNSTSSFELRKLVNTLTEYSKILGLDPAAEFLCVSNDTVLGVEWLTESDMEKIAAWIDRWRANHTYIYKEREKWANLSYDIQNTL